MPSPSNTNMSNERTDAVTVVSGSVAGIVAWIVGYALTYLIAAPDVRDSPLNRILEAFDGDPATYEMVGWVFYNAHFVDTVFRDLPLIGNHTASFVSGDEGFTALLYVVPIGLLFASGVFLSRYRGATDPVPGAVAGMMAVPGYLLASVVGVFLFEVTIGGASGAPDLLPAIFLAGIVYPLLFAGAGGVVGSTLENRDRTRQAG